MPTQTVPETLSRREFFTALGVTYQTFLRYRRAGLLPEPSRLKGSPVILWTSEYLRTCKKIVTEIRKATADGRRLKARDLVDLQRKGLL